MQIKSKYNWLKHADFMILDVVALFISFGISYLLKFGDLNFFFIESWMKLLLVMTMLSILITFFTNPYSGILRRSYYMEIIRGFQLAIYNLVFATMIVYLFKVAEKYSREVFFVTYGLYFFIALLVKYIWKKMLVSGKITVKTTKRIPLFIVSDSDNVERTIRNVSAGDFQLYDIKGICLVDCQMHVSDKHGISVYAASSPISQMGHGQIDNESLDFGGHKIPIVHEVVDYVLNHNIVDVLIAVEPNKLNKEVYEQLGANGIGVNMVVENLIGFQPEDQYIQNFGTLKSLSIGAFSFTPGQVLYLIIKRFIDLIVGFFGLIMLVPIIVIVKIACLLTGDNAKIFYRQNRVGQDGKIIRIWKFRSMVPNADEMLKEMLKEEKWQKQWEVNQKFDNDPRITRVGRILRKTSIDELPQLVNVLFGDMSLVGPRPLVEGELESHGGLKLYQKVKPGITGWWGCNGRSNIDYSERLDLEYYYVKHCSLYLDLLCVIRTMFAVIKKDGAQ